MKNYNVATRRSFMSINNDSKKVIAICSEKEVDEKFMLLNIKQKIYLDPKMQLAAYIW